jgi:hypothetical protein
MKIRTYMQWFFKVEGHLCNFGNCRVLFAKTARAAGGGAEEAPHGEL